MEFEMLEEEPEREPGSRRALRWYRVGVIFPALVAAAANLVNILSEHVFDISTGTTRRFFGGMPVDPPIVTLIVLGSLLLSAIFFIGGYLRFGWPYLFPKLFDVLTSIISRRPEPPKPIEGGEAPLKTLRTDPQVNTPIVTDQARSEPPPSGWEIVVRDRLNDVAWSAATTLKRLNTEVRDLGRRNNTNLSIGIGITVIGIGALFYYVYEWQMHPLTKADLPWGMLNFVPRLSLVILIEIFAYFFLGLYRSGLAEVKYFQNEMTNLESKVLALRVAIEHKDAKTTASVVTKLADTERNLVLRKGETTPEIEMSRLQREQLTKLVGELTKLAGRVQGATRSRKKKKTTMMTSEE
jgi:hypothetical protein